jgi:ABC-type uncharacterized transport system substrate-binding protein
MVATDLLALAGLFMAHRLCALVLSLIAGMVVAAAEANAHPHVWVTMKSEVVYAPDGSVVGVQHAWTFDDMFSAFATQGLESKKKGEFTREELKPLAEVNVKSLKDFDYFTFVHIGDADNLPLKPPENYSLDYDKSLLTLHFTLPLQTPLDPRGKDVQVDVYDPSFFVAFGFATEAPVKLSGDAIKGCSAEIKKPDPESEEDAKALSEAFFSQLGPNSNFGSQFAQTVMVKCSDAPS